MGVNFQQPSNSKVIESEEDVGNDYDSKDNFGAKVTKKKKKISKNRHGYALGFGSSNIRKSAPSLEVRDDDISRVIPPNSNLKNVQTSAGGKLLILGEIQEEV